MKNRIGLLLIAGTIALLLVGPISGFAVLSVGCLLLYLWENPIDETP